MSRLDTYLVKQSLAPSRTKAQEMIQRGHVEVMVNNQFQVTKKPHFKVTSKNDLRLNERELLRYVARSGLKLQYAIDKLGIDPSSKRVLDIGLSTGGFAHCLLERGALEVVGVDVGRDQLHPRLKSHPRLTSLESLNARYLRREWVSRGLDSSKKFDLITVDVSFISLKHILPEIPLFLTFRGEFLALVKPQFEQDNSGENIPPKISQTKVPLSPSRTSPLLQHNYRKQKTIFSSENYEKVEVKIKNLCQSLPFNVKSYIPSQLPGRDGNKEFFIYGQCKHPPSL